MYPYCFRHGIELIRPSSRYASPLACRRASYSSANHGFYKQILHDRATFIAALFRDPDERVRYQAAAVTLRVPYVDWAARPPDGEGLLPGAITDSPTIDVYGPNQVQTIANPLFTYRFKPFNAAIFIMRPVRPSQRVSSRDNCCPLTPG
jgi:hypothetical protein